MKDYEAVLSAAQELTEEDRLRLIGALTETISDETEYPLSSEWAAEIEHRLRTLRDGSARTIPWEEIRDAALMRGQHGTNR